MWRGHTLGQLSWAAVLAKGCTLQHRCVGAVALLHCCSTVQPAGSRCGRFLGYFIQLMLYACLPSTFCHCIVQLLVQLAISGATSVVDHRATILQAFCNSTFVLVVHDCGVCDFEITNAIIVSWGRMFVKFTRASANHVHKGRTFYCKMRMRSRPNFHGVC